ncbi:MAG: hypothetical protein ACI9CD_001272 [Candidatus Deianiraeaceae bacterium]|jgi:hypothetical protein
MLWLPVYKYAKYNVYLVKRYKTIDANMIEIHFESSTKVARDENQGLFKK